MDKHRAIARFKAMKPALNQFVQEMAKPSNVTVREKCYECGAPAKWHGVEKWTVDGFRQQVPTCADHSTCTVCHHTFEVNPISLRVECFSHRNG